ncbi:hypothetical protein C8Q78DRAFT_442806 [Trametes maxima]|nr:hypothetical protein C8Q78DRAFT_442806 [Trametes maxima]
MYFPGNILRSFFFGTYASWTATSIYAHPMAASSPNTFILGRYRPDDPITRHENYAKIARAGHGYRNADAAVLPLSMRITAKRQSSQRPLLAFCRRRISRPGGNTDSHWNSPRTNPSLGCSTITARGRSVVVRYAESNECIRYFLKRTVGRIQFKFPPPIRTSVQWAPFTQMVFITELRCDLGSFTRASTQCTALAASTLPGSKIPHSGTLTVIRPFLGCVPAGCVAATRLLWPSASYRWVNESLSVNMYV